jgi:hypothetical protein
MSRHIVDRPLVGRRGRGLVCATASTRKCPSCFSNAITWGNRWTVALRITGSPTRASKLGTRFRMQFETHAAARVPSGSRFVRSASWSAERGLQRPRVNAVPTLLPMQQRLRRPAPRGWKAVPPQHERGPKRRLWRRHRRRRRVGSRREPISSLLTSQERYDHSKLDSFKHVRCRAGECSGKASDLRQGPT